MWWGKSGLSQEQEGLPEKGRKKKKKIEQKIAGWVLVTVASGGERKRVSRETGFLFFEFIYFLFRTNCQVSIPGRVFGSFQIFLGWEDFRGR